MDALTTEIKNLLANQKTEWELARKNFAGLNKVQVRTFQFDGFKVKVQFNPGRIVSSAAKVDKKSVEERPCFLCEVNRPEEQRGVTFNDFSILVNPFPIFPEHFTVPTFAHTPQVINGNFGHMLDLARVMQEFTIFYNGPKCGASAPDHFHFQAGTNGFMPIDNEIDFLIRRYGTKIFGEDRSVWSIKDGLRNFILLESTDKTVLESSFSKIYNCMEEDANEEEAMMNILASFQRNIWRVLIFPRALHRPAQYFEEGEKNILLSPASVDMGGVFITPLEKDFKKITKDDIKDIFAQVLLNDESFDKLINRIKTKAWQ